jgi:hypothetical protein
VYARQIQSSVTAKTMVSFLCKNIQDIVSHQALFYFMHGLAVSGWILAQLLKDHYLRWSVDAYRLLMVFVFSEG